MSNSLRCHGLQHDRLLCPGSQSLLKLMSIDSVMPSNHPIICHPLLLPSIFPSTRCFFSFPMRWLFTSGGQSIGASTSASVLPITIQGWFPFWLTGLISLLPKGLSRVFSSLTVQKHQFFSTQPSLSSNSHIHDYWKNHNFDCTDACQQNSASAF